MRDLSDIRKDIDEVDESLRELLKKRLSYAEEVAEYKLKNDKPILDVKREEEKLATLTDGIDDEFLSQSVYEMFSQLMSISRKKQYRMMADRKKVSDFGFKAVSDLKKDEATVVFQGVPGAYSQVAMNEFFCDMKASFHVDTWRDAIESLLSEKADFAVLPIENSTAGAIIQNYDLLSEYDVAIVGEQIIKASHALLGVEGADISDIKTVYSHPQAILQCDRYLRERHPEFKAVAMQNTAMAAQKVRDDNDRTAAAIAGKINASIYGLSVIEEAIQDDASNETRFIIVSAKKIFLSTAKKVSICFELPHEKGSLYRALSHFIFNGVNMTGIESRPIVGRQWEYRFFIDVEGNLFDERVVSALTGLFAETSALKILGNY